MQKKSRFKSAFAHKAKKDLAYEKDQQEKRNELNIEDENIIIIEKSNNYKFTINNLKALVQLICIIVIIVLSSVGLLGLIYPAPREAILSIIYEAMHQLQAYIQ